MIPAVSLVKWSIPFSLNYLNYLNYVFKGIFKCAFLGVLGSRALKIQDIMPVFNSTLGNTMEMW